MGISNLNQLIKRQCPEVVEELPLDQFKGRRVAIDASNWSFLSWATAYKDVINRTDVGIVDPDRSKAAIVWFQHLWCLLRRFLYNGVTPVFVLDGQSPPDKNITKTERADKKRQLRDKIAECRQRMAKMDILDRSEVILSDLRKLMRQETYVTREEYQRLEDVLTTIGVPFIRAPGEAEQFGSMLALDGYVAAVYSTDTDTLAYGCPIVIRAFTFHQGHDYVETVSIDRVLRGLDLTFSQFQDLCIMAGCDYNTNIRGIGIVKAYQLIKEHGLIEQLPDKYDRSVLRHERCRELFRSQSSLSLMPDLTLERLNVDRDRLSTARDLLSQYEIDDWLLQLAQYYHYLPEPESRGYYAAPGASLVEMV